MAAQQTMAGMGAGPAYIQTGVDRGVGSTGYSPYEMDPLKSRPTFATSPTIAMDRGSYGTGYGGGTPNAGGLTPNAGGFRPNTGSNIEKPAGTTRQIGTDADDRRERARQRQRDRERSLSGRTTTRRDTGGYGGR